ncbi:TPA: TULIP family P47-like protein [Clostridium botulinum]|uniref:TULIP family P47-like protein n=1 Tax=Clostridium TaxID=1485 RepID=UPI00077449F8|nr:MULTISPECIES: TULIP family P47-like protein [Clostridium]AUM94647.1 hypothetical protein RSJ11_05570 [Clostridium sporogenes]AVQ52082.1 hypothetical protein C7M59_04090 [Clostridium botulinum]HBJ2612246.1 TULIP family P47-like protein [Clostridium botulinum]
MDTTGWDIVYLCSKKSTNKSLNRYMKQNNLEVSYNGPNIKIDLLFDPWEIIDGSGNKIIIKTPVKKGKLVFNTEEIIELDGICPVINVELDFFNSNTEYNTKNLMFNFSTKDNKSDNNLYNFMIMNPDINGIIDDEETLGILKFALEKVFLTNQSEFSYIFAEMNLSPEQEWMKPQKYVYTYLNPATGQDGFLTILSVVTNRDISKLGHSGFDEILNDKNDIFLLLSEKMFLENIILPKLPESFGNGATLSDFKFKETSETTGEIVNVNHLNTEAVKWGAVYYHPKITELRIRIEGSTMVINADGNFNYGGRKQFFWVKSVNKFIYDKYTKKAFFIPDDNPSYRYKKNVPKWAWITGGVVVVLTIVEVCKSVAKNVARSVAFEASDSLLGNIDPDIISWNESQGIDVQNAILDVAFGIQGNYE